MPWGYSINSSPVANNKQHVFSKLHLHLSVKKCDEHRTWARPIFNHPQILKFSIPLFKKHKHEPFYSFLFPLSLTQSFKDKFHMKHPVGKCYKLWNGYVQINIF
jgi:hypothetical protein